MLKLKNISIALLLFSIFPILGTSQAQTVEAKNQLVQLEQTISELNQEFASGAITTAATAELAISKIDSAQLSVQKILQEQEGQCHEHFFTTACFDHLRLKRRQFNELLRRISVEAKSFLRRVRVTKSVDSEGKEEK